MFAVPIHSVNEDGTYKEEEEEEEMSCLISFVWDQSSLEEHEARK